MAALLVDDGKDGQVKRATAYNNELVDDPECEGRTVKRAVLAGHKPRGPARSDEATAKALSGSYPSPGSHMVLHRAP